MRSIFYDQYTKLFVYISSACIICIKDMLLILVKVIRLQWWHFKFAPYSCKFNSPNQNKLDHTIEFFTRIFFTVVFELVFSVCLGGCKNQRCPRCEGRLSRSIKLQSHKLTFLHKKMFFVFFSWRDFKTSAYLLHVNMFLINIQPSKSDKPILNYVIDYCKPYHYFVFCSSRQGWRLKKCYFY